MGLFSKKEVRYRCGSRLLYTSADRLWRALGFKENDVAVLTRSETGRFIIEQATDADVAEQYACAHGEYLPLMLAEEHLMILDTRRALKGALMCEDDWRKFTGGLFYPRLGGWKPGVRFDIRTEDGS